MTAFITTTVQQQEVNKAGFRLKTIFARQPCFIVLKIDFTLWPKNTFNFINVQGDSITIFNRRFEITFMVISMNACSMGQANPENQSLEYFSKFIHSIDSENYTKRCY